MLLKLFICFSGIFISFLLNGYSVENITTSFGEKIFKFYAFMVLVPALFNSLVGKMILFFESQFASATDVVSGDPGVVVVPKSFYFRCSVFQMSSMLCANASLAFINYPTQLVLKSCKPVIILLFGIFCLTKKAYNSRRILSTCVIVLGVTTFMYHQYNTKNNDIKKNPETLKISKQDSSKRNYIIGVSLVLCSLCFDGLLAMTQKKVLADTPISGNMLMYYGSVYSSGMLAIGVLLRNELGGFVEFIVDQPRVVFYLIMLGLTSACGQFFICYTVSIFGPLTCSVITTVRKFFQILLSVILFLHFISVEMWMSVFLVFIGLGLDIWTQFLRKPHAMVEQQAT